MTVLAPITATEFADFKVRSIATYAREKIASGEWAEAGSLEAARDAFNSLLPQGPETPGNHVFALRAETGGPPIGVLWFAERKRAGQRIAYLYEIVIHPQFRRQGHASRAFQLLEGTATEMGLSGIALHVFAHNKGAQALYESLGYQASNITMFKPVSA